MQHATGIAVPIEDQQAFHHPAKFGPAVVWLCAGFLLAGMGTVLLGPILPLLSAQWGMSDSAAGMLLVAKFTGAFAGGVTVPQRLRNGILLGCAAACVGFVAFGFATGPVSGALTLFVAGFGLGQMIASTNILAGRRYDEHTGTALAAINFFWAAGAVITGVVVARWLPHGTLRGLLLTFGAMLLAVGLAGWLHRTHAGERPAAADALPDGSTAIVEDAADDSVSLPRRLLLIFEIMLFLYGGLETSLTQWVTTYSLRYGDSAVLGGQSAMVLMWVALTAGRAVTSLALRRWSERTVQRVGLVASAVLIAVLAMSHGTAMLSWCCILLGLSLAPFFPATFAMLLRHRPRPREAGAVLAISGLGAAALSGLVGLISTHAASLRIAMVVPFAAAAGLLVASVLVARTERTLRAARAEATLLQAVETTAV